MTLLSNVEHYSIPQYGSSEKNCSCGEVGVLNKKYDARYCPVGNVWLEDICGDDNCIYCSDRPERLNNN